MIIWNQFISIITQLVGPVNLRILELESNHRNEKQQKNDTIRLSHFTGHIKVHNIPKTGIRDSAEESRLNAWNCRWSITDTGHSHDYALQAITM